jgi:leucyl-tRNA synthetase
MKFDSLIILDACLIYGADPVRFAFAVGGDTLEDPNYTIENVETAILQTYTLFDWIKVRYFCFISN